jgi:hypothetical protein
MSGFSLIVVLYLLVPGFIADTAFRTVRGLQKGEEADRVLRSLVWSLFGLGVYLAVADAPEYLRQLGTGNTAPSFTSANLVGLAGHTLLSTAIAALCAKVLETKTVRDAIQTALGRTLAERPPWDFMWTDDAPGRFVRVTLKDGRIYWGHKRAASTGPDEKELVLSDLFIEEAGKRKYIPDARLMYIPGGEIAEIRLSPTQEEADAARPQ